MKDLSSNRARACLCFVKPEILRFAQDDSLVRCAQDDIGVRCAQACPEGEADSEAVILKERSD